MANSGNGRSGGLGIGGVLGVVFIVLKLTGVIDWSWLWVLSPFWIPIGIALLIIAIFGVCVLIFDGIEALSAGRSKKSWRDIADE